MNCKPGDLAVIVTVNGYEHLAFNIGRIVEVNRLSHEWIDTWECRVIGAPLRVSAASGMGTSTDCLIADAILRPIRDPGDDVKDETLEWLPVPTKEIA